MKYHLITYGCQMNEADAQELAQPLKSRGFWATADRDQADVILMNTCTVRDNAEHKADSEIGRLRKWKEADPNRILVVAGCAATQWGDLAKKKYPFIDLVSPATRIENFPEAITSVLRDRWNEEATLSSSPPARVEEPMDPRQRLSGETSGSDSRFSGDQIGYVTIMRGCNMTCSYCIVPQVRGREMYRPADEILADVGQRLAEGFKEIMLLGQTVNSYYWRNADQSVWTFSDLLHAVSKIPDLGTIRFMSPHPKHFRDDLIETIATHPTISRQLHIPLQSGSTRLLERMKRLYTREDFLTMTQKLKASVPGMTLSTDVIVGFPGETDADFEETLSLLETIGFHGIFAFKYSPRPGTASAGWPDDVPQDVKEARLQRVLSLAHRLAAA